MRFRVQRYPRQQPYPSFLANPCRLPFHCPERAITFLQKTGSTGGGVGEAMKTKLEAETGLDEGFAQKGPF